MKEFIKRNRYYVLFIFIIGATIGMVFSLTLAEIVEKTADDKFCGYCHIMQPMVKSFLQDSHGGNNKVGFKAKCVDCHLPHNNVTHYLFEKARLGINDVIGNVFFDPKNHVNWEEKRKEAKNYVPDSGCSHCHSNLRDATSSNLKAFLPHRDYFEKYTTKTCVECHANEVGHKNLSKHLKDYLKDNYRPYPNSPNKDGLSQ
ncbi:cytochrome c3 family protein [Helicobacter cetorum]|uniref:Tetraheme Cytochrom c n=1 Tax=Helicobacter cetorum (strain ATCC BAA-540 / CCUG 52418 / MIT 99-5656) TaxID=1163745 RepID=I0ES21_HELCM|nr:NapC/NirT family cytochrome c [Helicobacter cetorum]AFI05740.1 tetraheme Cytochrom c [Helicobacter cetorum MIT 99-5656]